MAKNTTAKNVKTKAATTKAARTKGEVTIVQPGPRGFRFGAAFIQSVIDGTGIAAKTSNKAKVVEFAKTLGVAGVSMKTEITEALKTMKAAAKKHLNANFETA